MKFERSVLMIAALLAVSAAAVELPPSSPGPPPPESVTPMSDAEETGELIGAVHDRVEPMALPEEENVMDLTDAERAARDAGSLFPSDLWPGAPVMPQDVPDFPGAVTESTEAGAPGEPPPPDVFASVFGANPPPPLHDPHGLLTSAQRAALLALIRDSLNVRGSFLTSVVVLEASDQIPIMLNPPELLERWHGDNKGLLVLYFFGAPGRTQAFFTPATRLSHRSEDLRQIIEFGVREAARLPTPLAQLQRFCYKSAIRLDRLHRQGNLTLADDGTAPVPSVPVTGLWWAFAVGVQAAALAAGAVWWWRRRRAVFGGRDGRIIRFPDQDVIARLGAPHSGGSGAVLQFGITAQRL